MDDKLKVRREITRKIRAIGSAFDFGLGQNMAQLYAPLLSASPRDGVKVTKDLHYGPHERHRLDLYQPEEVSAGPSPILIFVHGGGFVRGDKSECENVGYHFARQGILTINATYRLAPEHKWPSGAEDSAGAAHVATYMFFDEFQLKEGDGVAGAILISGPNYTIDHVMEWEFSYYGEDRSKHQDMSVIHRLEGRKIPIFLLFAEYDIPGFDNEAITLFNALYRRDGVSPFLKRLIDHNHISEIMQFNTGDVSVGPDIVDFIYSREAAER